MHMIAKGFALLCLVHASFLAQPVASSKFFPSIARNHGAQMGGSSFQLMASTEECKDAIAKYKAARVSTACSDFDKAATAAETDEEKYAFYCGSSADACLTDTKTASTAVWSACGANAELDSEADHILYTLSSSSMRKLMCAKVDNKWCGVEVQSNNVSQVLASSTTITEAYLDAMCTPCAKLYTELLAQAGLGDSGQLGSVCVKRDNKYCVLKLQEFGINVNNPEIENANNPAQFCDPCVFDVFSRNPVLAIDASVMENFKSVCSKNDQGEFCINVIGKYQMAPGPDAEPNAVALAKCADAKQDAKECPATCLAAFDVMKPLGCCARLMSTILFSGAPFGPVCTAALPACGESVQGKIGLSNIKPEFYKANKEYVDDLLRKDISGSLFVSPTDVVLNDVVVDGNNKLIITYTVRANADQKASILAGDAIVFTNINDDPKANEMKAEPSEALAPAKQSQVSGAFKLTASLSVAVLGAFLCLLSF